MKLESHVNEIYIMTILHLDFTNQKKVLTEQ